MTAYDWWLPVGQRFRQFRYVEFLIKSIPVIAFTFIGYMTFRDLL
ncbi:MAG: hypothetical protein QHC90_24730 [Shinella sp.]|nr:hypothetical protein [Shinella sp.]